MVQTITGLLLCRYNVRMLCVWGTDGERPNTIHDGRSARAGRVRCGTAALRGGARGALRRGGVGAIAGPRELESALLEADDAVADVLGVRVHGRRHDPRHVVRQVVGRVEARVARSIPPALPVLCAPGKEAEAPGTAAPNATERLDYQRGV